MGAFTSSARRACKSDYSPAGPARSTVIAAIAAAACATVLTACGGSAPNKPRGSAGNGFLAFSQCMRSDGVPKFPDPTGGGGIHLLVGSGIDPSSPAFQAAQAKCQKLLPGGGPPRSGASAQDKAQMLAVSQCMRAHGVSGFPDPTTGTPPSPSQANLYSLVMDRGGLILAVPKSINPRSPVFQAASQKCGFGPGSRGRTQGL